VAVVLGAHSVGAPHIRQRLWWVARRLGHAEQGGLRRRCLEVLFEDIFRNGSGAKGTVGAISPKTSISAKALSRHSYP
jgi:hypothetical protein